MECGQPFGFFSFLTFLPFAGAVFRRLVFFFFRDSSLELDDELGAPPGTSERGNGGHRIQGQT